MKKPIEMIDDLQRQHSMGPYEVVSVEDCVQLMEKYAEAKADQHETIVMLPETAKNIIAVRDAYISGDMEDVWHFLYKVADNECEKLEPWKELEELAEKAT